ncbi:threonine aspartase 1 [Aricia agestis]|uniref:threonine aspartase 1 n=1 Tax=Aricia agestis TaxID=91739 RepID=UPI001C20333B|nr:threonine aspartase 1 [Aricia agestis]XP_041979747.1 threonine aspartase 1 [Aricia agestis]XP_041979748.1 threonine aspartase 1 [Aricia agestis]
MNGFIAVHCGAGYHSESLKKDYQKTCFVACRKAAEILSQGGNAVDAVEKAIIELENSPLTNAGYGSNLSWNGLVECDASIMNGQTLHFGACGAVSNVWNPISLAKQLCMKQCESLSLGRIPPCILTGRGARSWAERMGLQIVDDSKMVSAKAFRNYKHSKRKLKRYSLQNDLKFSPLDTVGAICVDSNGIVASGASSGGVSLKHEGRVGQAASFGSGVWAVMSRDGAKPSVAACTSGCGEHLIRTQLAKNTAESLLETSPVLGLDKCLQDNFLKSPFLWDVSERLGGTLGLVFNSDVGDGELLWGHTTKTMCIGYMSTETAKPKCVISYLPPRVNSGQKAVVSGLPFKITMTPCPVLQWDIKTDLPNGSH